VRDTHVYDCCVISHDGQCGDVMLRDRYRRASLICPESQRIRRFALAHVTYGKESRRWERRLRATTSAIEAAAGTGAEAPLHADGRSGVATSSPWPRSRPPSLLPSPPPLPPPLPPPPSSPPSHRRCHVRRYVPPPGTATTTTTTTTTIASATLLVSCRYCCCFICYSLFVSLSLSLYRMVRA